MFLIPAVALLSWADRAAVARLPPDRAHRRRRLGRLRGASPLRRPLDPLARRRADRRLRRGGGRASTPVRRAASHRPSPCLGSVNPNRKALALASLNEPRAGPEPWTDAPTALGGPLEWRPWLPKRSRPTQQQTERRGRDGARTSPASTARATPRSNALRGVDLDVAARQAHRRHGPVGLGQVDAHAHPRRPGQADRGRRSPSTAPSIANLERHRPDEAPAASTSASSSSSSTCSRC